MIILLFVLFSMALLIFFKPSITGLSVFNSFSCPSLSMARNISKVEVEDVSGIASMLSVNVSRAFSFWFGRENFHSVLIIDDNELTECIVSLSRDVVCGCQGLRFLP